MIWLIASLAQAGDFEFGVAGGIHAIANNHELYDAALPQQPLGTMGAGLVRMGYYPLADIGVAVEADAGGSGNGTIYGVRGLLEAGWPIVTNRFDIAPFVVGGVGLIGVSGTPAGADSDMDYQWGVGLRMSASENVRLRFDFRHHPLAASGIDGVSNTFSAWVGVSFRPGAITKGERVRANIEELLSAYEETPSQAEIEAEGSPRQVEEALIDIARDPRVPPSRRGRAVTVVSTHPTQRVHFELQRLMGREVPKGWRGDARKADKAAAAAAPAVVASTPPISAGVGTGAATAPAGGASTSPVSGGVGTGAASAPAGGASTSPVSAGVTSNDPLARLVMRPAPPAPEPVVVDPNAPPPVVPPARKHPRKVDDAVFRKALISYSEAFPVEAVPLAAEVLQTTSDPLVRVAAVNALQAVDSPAAKDVLATVPALHVAVFDAAGRPQSRVPVTATLPDGRRRDGVGSLDLVDPTLPVGPVKIVAEASACQRVETTAQIQPGPAIQRLVLTSARPFPVSWTVVDDLNKPLAGSVRVTPLDRTEAACAPGDVPFSNGAGATAVGPGHYTLRVTADGYKFKDVDLQVAGGQIAPLSIQLEPTVLRVVSNQIVADPIYFDPKSDRITTGSDAAVDSVAQTILSADILRVTIHGHTDDAGADDVNMVLSQKRAEAVRDRLISLGVPADRLTAIGHGETQPVVAGTSAAARAKNRRVEFVLEAK